MQNGTSAPAFGRILRMVRKFAQLSQAQLAQQAGYSMDYVSMLERGIRRPSVQAIQQFIRVMQPSEADQATLWRAVRQPEVF